MAAFDRQVAVADGTLRPCRLVASETPPWRFAAEVEGIGRFETESRDLFDALAACRLWLAGHGAILLVAGAARDVYPSGMMRENGGRMAYRIRLGRRAERADVVDIFAPADPCAIATVAEQKENFEGWRRSLAP